MYKVFIDNKASFFDVKNEKELLKKFADHQFIEAAGGIVQRENKFLFIKRNGFWDIPKGKLEKRESPEQGAIREIEEECGLIQPIIKKHLIDTWHTYVHKKKRVLKKTYWFWLDEGSEKVKLVPQIEEGITELDFFGQDKFEMIKENTFLSIVEVILVLEQKL